MASGKKNYFRHHFGARKHPDIAGLIEDLGKEAYFHFFALVEVCAEKASDGFPEGGKFTFRRSTLCHELLVTNSRLSRHLVPMTPSLVDHILVTEKEVEIVFPKLAKYMGRYDSKSSPNSPNKRKEKERKEKEIQEPSAEPVVSATDAPGPKKILSEVGTQENPKNLATTFFEPDDKQELEEISADETAIKILTALNSICFKNFRPVKSNLQFINARLKEKYSYEDFVAVIKHRQSLWGHSAKMREFLRPKTLFNSENFDGYAQEAKNADKPIVDPLDAFFEQYAPGSQVSAS